MCQGIVPQSSSVNDNLIGSKLGRQKGKWLWNDTAPRTGTQATGATTDFSYVPGVLGARISVYKRACIDMLPCEDTADGCGEEHAPDGDHSHRAKKAWCSTYPRGGHIAASRSRRWLLT